MSRRSAAIVTSRQTKRRPRFRSKARHEWASARPGSGCRSPGQPPSRERRHGTHDRADAGDDAARVVAVGEAPGRTTASAPPRSADSCHSSTAPRRRGGAPQGVLVAVGAREDDDPDADAHAARAPGGDEAPPSTSTSYCSMTGSRGASRRSARRSPGSASRVRPPSSRCAGRPHAGDAVTPRWGRLCSTARPWGRGSPPGGLTLTANEAAAGPASGAHRR